MKKQLLIFLAICHNLISQIPKAPVNIQSPNASSFNAIADYKIASFAGNPSINIGLCNLNDGALNLPIGLSINTSGVRPDIHPGWLGLNTNLNLGGAVVRTVKDGADDSFIDLNSSQVNLLNTTTNVQIGFMQNYADTGINGVDWKTTEGIESIGVMNFTDTEPDEYSFFAGDNISGKFFFGHDGSWRVQSDQAIKIELIKGPNETIVMSPPFTPFNTITNPWTLYNSNKYQSHLLGFILTDENGTKYEFGGGNANYMEYSMDFFNQSQDTWVCNSWQLKSITTHTGQQINYTYERGNHIAQMHFGFNNTKYSLDGNAFINISCSSETSVFVAGGPYRGKLISPIYLKEVTTSNLKINLDSSESTELRYDEDVFSEFIDDQLLNLNGTLKEQRRVFLLANLYDCIDQNQSQCVKTTAQLLTKLQWRKLDRILVTNTYKNAEAKQFTFTYNSNANERLMLQTVQESGGGNTETAKPHEFFYYVDQNITLPPYSKSHTDNWGYNNGILINRSTDFNDRANYGTDYRGPASDSKQYLVGSLKKIKYPTGGFSEFIFEPHSYSKVVKLNRWEGAENPTTDQDAGGLRIKRIRTYDPNTPTVPIEKRYYYIRGFNPQSPDTTLSSSGVLGGKTQYYWQNYQPTLYWDSGTPPTYSEDIFTSQSVLPSTENSMGSHIGYSEIVEKTATGGWTIYKYSNIDNGFQDEQFEGHIQAESTPYEPVNSKAFTRGKLLSTENYFENGNPVFKTIQTYGLVNENHVRSVRTSAKVLCGSPAYFPLEGTAYKIFTSQFKPTNVETILYNQSGPAESVSSTEQYSYNEFGQVNEIKKSQSDGSKLISRMKYVHQYNRLQWNQCYASYVACRISCIFNNNCSTCDPNLATCKNTFDDGSRAILEMFDRHIWMPIETLHFRERNSIEKIIGGNLSIYKMFNGMPLLHKSHKLHLNSPVGTNTITLSEINSSKQFVFDANYKEPEITFVDYNSAGNPKEVKPRNGLTTSYVWGYKNRLPIAEIKNENYSTIASALGADENLLLNTYVTDDNIRTKINNLRSTSARKVTTYTHDIIYGVTSITNPANIKTLFEYDALSRLKTVKNHEENILKDIVYHFANHSIQSGIGISPTNTINYIATRMPRTEQSSINTNIDFTTTTIEYVDGIGRPIQNLVWKGSPDKGKDIISNSSLFDAAGRNHKTILPTRSDGILGGFKAGAEALANTFYRDTVARNETIFETSPLSRPSQQFGAGQEWRTGTPKPQKFFYETTGSTSIPLYTADDNGIIKGTASYPLDQLIINKIQDEKGNEIVEIKDTDGKIIQKRMVDDDNVLMITHFVYNDLNQLKGVIQPNAYPLSADLAKTSDNLFFYNYDIRGRIIEKKVPASDLEYFVYDQWDRIVLSQTPLQKPSNKWSFYKYDVFNREILRGEKTYNNTDTQASLQLSAATNNNRAESKNTTPPIFYNYNSSFPILNYVQNNTSSDYIYQINFYDSYEYTNNWASGLDYVPNETIHSQITLNGSLTGTKVLGKPKDNNNNWLSTAYYYDFKNRLIQSRKAHLLATTANVCSYEYNFVGELLKKKTTHKKSGKSDLIEIVLNTLDHMGRIKFIDQTVGNITKRIAVYEYDDIGRMVTKNLGTPANFTGSNLRQSVDDGDWTNDATWNNFQIPNIGSLVEISHLVTIPVSQNAFAGDIILNTNTLVPNGTLTLGGTSSMGNALQKVDYQHHIRGGLKGINLDISQSLALNSAENDFFSYKLDYDFDYNIKKQSWKHEGIANNRSYDFTYDKSHRLQSATYLPASQDISITNLDYDKNGNISKLQRDGKKGAGYGQIDDLTYDYTGNRLTHMTEGEAGNYDVDFVKRGNQNYTYYNDGSLKSDDNENIIEILYDSFLRQPTQMTLTGNRKIDYIYSGAGELVQTDYTGTITEKWNNVENLIYKGLEYYSLNTGEGRVNYTNSNWEFEYFITDHLGNVRVSFKDNGSGVATKTAITDRDPLGVILRNTQIINGIQNRNEFQSAASELTFGLNRIDLGARTMNPTIGKMDRVDNYSEKYMNLSNYQFAGNNSLKYIDINGDSLFVNIYNENNSLTKLSWGYTKEEGYGLYTNGKIYTGNNKFANIISNALSHLNLTKEGEKFLTNVSAISEEISINETADRNVTQEEKIYVNPTLTGINTPTENGNKESPFFITLGHEIAHGFANTKGFKFKDWLTIPTSSGDRVLSSSEIYASHIENIFRSGYSFPLRTHYSPLAGGGVLEETRLIDSNRSSIHFKEGQLGPNQINFKHIKGSERFKY